MAAKESSHLFRRRDTGGRAAPSVFKHKDFWITWFLGVLVFAVVEGLFTFHYFGHSAVILTICFIGLTLCGVMISLRKTAPRFLPMALVCAFSILLGTFFGLYCFDTFQIFGNFYSSSREYTNVVPSVSAGSVADAGRLVFSAESSVDITRSISYFVGQTKYCIAPIRDLNEINKIEFWAVGVDCCGWEGNFVCDAASDASAHGGIVVYDNMGWFQKSNRDFYVEAQKKAEAQFDLIAAEKPIYVRWVGDGELNSLAEKYKLDTQLFLAITILVNVLVCGGFSYIFAKNALSPGAAAMTSPA